MNVERLAKLTDAQREVLRLWHERKSAKEIALDIGVTHWAVNERLRSARRTLQVATSEEAARMLIQEERVEAYKRLVYEPGSLADVGREAIMSPSASDGDWLSQASRGHAAQEQAGYPAHSWRDVKWPFPLQEGNHNDLTIRSRLFWIGSIAIAILVAVSALIAIAGGAGRMVAQIIRALS